MSDGAIQWGLLAREAGLLLICVLIALGAWWAGFVYTPALIATLTTLQLGVYLFTTFRRVFNHINHDDMSIKACLTSLAVMVTFFVLAYAVDYTLLTAVDNASLKNFDPPTLFYRFADGLYFSTVTFTATGFGEYVPMTYPAKTVVWGQMVLGFTTTVFAVSSFISLTDRD